MTTTDVLVAGALFNRAEVAVKATVGLHAMFGFQMRHRLVADQEQLITDQTLPHRSSGCFLASFRFRFVVATIVFGFADAILSLRCGSRRCRDVRRRTRVDSFVGRGAVRAVGRSWRRRRCRCRDQFRYRICRRAVDRRRGRFAVTTVGFRRRLVERNHVGGGMIRTFAGDVLFDTGTVGRSKIADRAAEPRYRLGVRGGSLR
ncbi:hypothetical protein T07_7778 [Trichinella nelsoni]|uniref:Uncharacterized protein n=1 Tax=Trichinella nelsoni TaxID=6336 RepID=A0A0V0SEB1_9BILA|nr:hypothetical protein T07_7778 [Trichinella nelsoni]